MDEKEVKEPRKATDIILSLEEKVNNLIKIVAVYDMNIKIILDRVNKIYSYIDILQKEYDEDQKAPEQEIFKSPEHPIAVAENITGQRRTSRVEIPIEIEEAPIVAGKKIPVSQRVSYQTGNDVKDAFLAEVSILDSNKQLLKKTKTNPSGVWQELLKPGNYTVNIVKTNTSTKEKLEASQEITVRNSNEPITLKPILIKR